jgi:hypothetical protein
MVQNDHDPLQYSMTTSSLHPMTELEEYRIGTTRQNYISINQYLFATVSRLERPSLVSIRTSMHSSC